MSNHLKVFIICFTISLVGAVVFTCVSFEGVTYSQGITAEELESLTYFEAAEIMKKHAIKMTAIDFFTQYIGTLFFWQTASKAWLALFIACYAAILSSDRWRHA